MKEQIITISRMSLLGQGVGTDDEGHIYFVPKALPGDTVRVTILSQDKKYFECHLEEVLVPSAQRVIPSCPYFHECGGCDWLHWNYSDQLAGKQKMIEHAMQRGELKPLRVHPILGAKSPLGYRNRIQLRAMEGKLGFFRKKSHDIVDIESCKIAQPQLNLALQQLRSSPLIQSHQMKKIELYLSQDGEVKQVCDAAHAIDGFRQINEEQNAVLQKTVADAVVKSQAHRVLELFCGNGNLTFAYLDRVKEILAVDASGPAIQKARNEWEERKTTFSGISVTFVRDLVGKMTSRKLPAKFKEGYDTLIVDPPRSGLAGALSSLVHPKLKNIIYISCSVQSFTQDVQCLKNHFQFDELQPVDMFPQTRHIEFVAQFSRISC